MGEKLKVRRCDCSIKEHELVKGGREAYLDLLVLAMEVRSWREGLAIGNEGEWFPSDLRGKAVLPEMNPVESSRNVFL